MAKKKKKTAKKKVAKKTAKPKVAKVEMSGGEDGLEVKSVPALVEEATMKVVDQGHTTYYTKTEYDKKFSKKEK
jgi:hypothetical protein